MIRTNEERIQDVLLQIKNYADDHSLTPKQIKDIFHEGIVASVVSETLKLDKVLIREM